MVLDLDFGCRALGVSSDRCLGRRQFSVPWACATCGALQTDSTSRWQLLPAFFLPPPPSSFERVGRCPDSDRAATGPLGALSRGGAPAACKAHGF